MSLRPVVSSDLVAVLALHQEAMGQAAWTEAQWLAALSGRYRTFLIEYEGQLAAIAVFHRMFEELELQTVVVAKDYRRRGLAQQLITYAVESEPDAERLLLEVDASNRPAVTLYEKLGFDVTAVRKNYYSHSMGSGDALLMTKSIERQ